MQTPKPPRCNWCENFSLLSIYRKLPLAQELAREESVDSVSQDLRDLDGLTPELIAKLADAGVQTRDDLADLAVDELTAITGQSEDDARALIMKAREHWFADSE